MEKLWVFAGSLNLRCFKHIKILFKIFINSQNFSFVNCSRKPFKLNGLLIPYNLAMAGLNLFICVRLLTASFRLRYSYICEPSRQIESKDEMQVSLPLQILLKVEFTFLAFFISLNSELDLQVYKNFFIKKSN